MRRECIPPSPKLRRGRPRGGNGRARDRPNPMWDYALRWRRGIKSLPVGISIGVTFRTSICAAAIRSSSGRAWSAFHQLAAIGRSLVEVNERRSVVVEVVTLQTSPSRSGTWFHPKKLTAGGMIKVDHFLRSAFHSQRADKGKMCEELLHLRSPDKVPSLSSRKGKTCHFVPSDAGTDLTP
jgi:hypothetical protein